MTPSSPDPTRPFYPIDDPEHPAPRDGTTVFGKLMFQDVPATFRVHFKNGAWRLPDGISIVHPVEWRPIPSTPPPAPRAAPEMIAFFQAHRACHNAEHDPINGKIHGYCIVCGTPWPCEYSKPDLLSAALARAEQAEGERDEVKEKLRKAMHTLKRIGENQSRYYGSEAMNMYNELK